MEKETVKILQHAVGIELLAALDESAEKPKLSWSLRIGFYWFGIILFRGWRSGETSRWTGINICYSVNRAPKEGDFIWLKHKKWGFHAA